MGATPGGIAYPDGIEPTNVPLDMQQLAESVEGRALQHTAATGRKRVHVQTGLTGTTDSQGYLTVNHGAPFTPRLVQASINGNALSLAVVMSAGDYTATTVRVRFTNWSAGGLANAVPLNGALALVCWE